MRVTKICLRGIQLKKVSFLLAVVSCVVLFLFAHRTYITSVEAEFYRLHFEEYALRADKNGSKPYHHCILPDYNHMDSTIMRYVRHWPRINCGHTQPFLTYVDEKGYIHRNQSGIEDSGISEADLQCTYEEIVRCNNTDDRFELRPPIIFLSPEPLISEFVVVKCYQLPYGRLVYETGHYYIPPPESKGLSPIPNDPKANLEVNVVKRNRPSIFFLVFDSMSRLNFMRQMPRTHYFLTDTLKAVVMKGLTKTGDNTYPNMLPMLAGMAAYKSLYTDDLVPGQKLWVPVWGGNNARYENFDDVPFVWKNFSNAGYLTMFVEDLPEYSIFNYLAKGFLNPPTDYYMRPFWLVVDGFKRFRSSDSRCYSNIPKHRYLFNYTEEFVMKMSNYSYFAFSFLTALSHDYLNSVQVVDHETESLLKRMLKSGALANTITVVMGDHGNRFDDIRSTVIGRVEERMPFFSIALPESLRESHPQLQRGLLANKDKLLSWFDIYELLMDVAMDNLGEESEVKRWGAVGLSPFRPVPKNRTCREIGIPRTYCVCGVEKEIDTKDSHAIESADTLLAHVNNLLKTAGAVERCAELKVVKVLSAQLLVPSAPITSPRGLILETRVSVETSPGGAHLEGVVERDAWSENGGHVIGEVNRINKYGNQSYCVKDLTQKLYCFCNSLLNKGT